MACAYGLKKEKKEKLSYREERRERGGEEMKREVEIYGEKRKDSEARCVHNVQSCCACSVAERTELRLK